jgi:hypothetical protein
MVNALSLAVMILTTAVGILAAMLLKHRAQGHELRAKIFSLRAAIYLERGMAAAEGTPCPKA